MVETASVGKESGLEMGRLCFAGSIWRDGGLLLSIGRGVVNFGFRKEWKSS